MTSSNSLSLVNSNTYQKKKCLFSRRSFSDRLISNSVWRWTVWTCYRSNPILYARRTSRHSQEVQRTTSGFAKSRSRVLAKAGKEKERALSWLTTVVFWGRQRYLRSAAYTNGTLYTVLLEVSTLCRNLHLTAYRLPVWRLITQTIVKWLNFLRVLEIASTASFL